MSLTKQQKNQNQFSAEEWFFLSAPWTNFPSSPSIDNHFFDAMTHWIKVKKFPWRDRFFFPFWGCKNGGIFIDSDTKKKKSLMKILVVLEEKYWGVWSFLMSFVTSDCWVVITVFLGKLLLEMCNLGGLWRLWINNIVIIFGIFGVWMSDTIW